MQHQLLKVLFCGTCSAPSTQTVLESASEVTTLWRYTNTFIIIIIRPINDKQQCNITSEARAAVAIDQYLLPAPDLSSKPAGRRCCCRSTGQTDGHSTAL